MNYIKGFNGLRAFSVLFVLIGHSGQSRLLNSNSFFQLFFKLFSPGTGVTIFFSLSGFLITTILLNEIAKNGYINFRYFFIRRFLKLLPPLILFYGAISCLMMQDLIKQDFTALALSFFYVYNFVPFSHKTNELSHTWSLAVEEQFYVLWPFIVSKLKSIRNVLTASIILIILCLLSKWIYQYLFHLNGKDIINVKPTIRWFFPACFPIITGSIASLLLNKNSIINHFFKKNNYILLLVLILFLLPDAVHSTIHFSYIAMKGLSASIFIMWIYCNQESVLIRILELKPLVFIGQISYGIYVYQGLFLTNGPGGKLFIQHFPQNLFLVFVTSIISYIFLEKKILAYKNKFNYTK